MYSIGVRDHFMIAHSFRGDTFGPAQQLHGATYVVDVELHRPALDPDGVVVDIGRLTRLVGQVLETLNYRNLDEDSTLAGRNTTTEFLSRVIFDRLAARMAEGALGPQVRGLTAMKITLHESHIAWASYEGSLTALLED